MWENQLPQLWRRGGKELSQAEITTEVYLNPALIVQFSLICVCVCECVTHLMVTH